MPVFTHVVPEDSPMLRMDAYCAKVFPIFDSRNQARKAIKGASLVIDGVKARTDWFPRPGTELVLTMPEPPVIPVLKMDIDVLYIDPHLAVVHKPAGMFTRGNHRFTVHRALLHNMERSDEPDSLAMPDPCHRLDFRTSGLLLVSRTASCRVELNRMFAERRIHKRYRALVFGRLEGEGEVYEPIEGRESLSRYRVVEHTRSLHVDWFTTVELEPVTGRTHQLRRHMTHLGHPVLGDDLYPGDAKVLRGSGLFLTAMHQSFVHPMTGEPMSVDAPEPHKFKALREREARRWVRRHPDTAPESPRPVDK
jgi:RluA family pseudouridine synthase